MIIKLGGVQIKNPSTFAVERYNITKSGRLADGKMAMDLIAKKRKLILTYEVLKGKDLDDILAIIDSDIMFFDVEYEYQGAMKTMKVYTGAINQQRFRTDSGWYWKDVTFNLIEQ